ncbi:MAG: flavodoxin domain-containing protein [Candidatus Omnitrophica bacterium]|nr:flavodoxin domain-containing protein [Candidatus Omnitrophota bacterium]MBU4477752.1 flavodoxin domain-containing protein [Candidatus Omnitrophota bacterium]MCG2703045.1 NAD(P)H-dependent oxidoreductase [Candidatus Omnitrophota bacterium]
MAKALVAYYSSTGHTKRMADEIAAALVKEGMNVTNKDIAQVSAEELINYDALVFGSPTYYGAMAYQVKKILDESVVLHGRLDGKIGAAFSSAANIAGGNETTILDILHAFLIHGMIIQGDPQGDHYGPVGIASPNERTINECKRLGKRVADLARKLFDK